MKTIKSNNNNKPAILETQGSQPKECDFKQREQFVVNVLKPVTLTFDTIPWDSLPDDALVQATSSYLDGITEGMNLIIQLYLGSGMRVEKRTAGGNAGLRHYAANELFANCRDNLDAERIASEFVAEHALECEAFFDSYGDVWCGAFPLAVEEEVELRRLFGKQLTGSLNMSIIAKALVKQRLMSQKSDSKH
jgi:hypothetical protein